MKKDQSIEYMENSHSRQKKKKKKNERILQSFCIKPFRPHRKKIPTRFSLVESNKHNKILENLKSKQSLYKPITFSHEVVSFFDRWSLETVPFIPRCPGARTDTSTQPIITVKQSHDTLNYCYLSASRANLSRKAGHENLRICLHRIHTERCRNA